MTVLRLLLLGINIVVIGAAGLRWASGLATRVTTRVLGGVSLAAGLIVALTLLLGLVGLGTNSVFLTVAAVAIWFVVVWRTPPLAHTLRSELVDRWAGAGLAAQASVGAVVAYVVALTAYQAWNPTVGGDGLRYHAAEPAVWLSGGHVGSFHQTLADFPTQAYPKTIEVLVTWCYAIGRTPLAALPLTIGLTVLAAASIFAGLRRYGVAPWIAGLAAAAGLLLPANIQEMTGVYTDVAALAWLACAAALCVCSADEPGAIGLGAVAAGLAIGTKPSTGPLALIALGAAIWINRGWVRRSVVRLLPTVALALALGAVWYVADWVKYGAPLWPFSTFPSGPTPPLVWREAGGAKFINDPVGVVQFVGWHPLLIVFGGGLVLLASVPLVAIAAVLPRARELRRELLLGVVVIVIATLLWADSEFTGVAGGAVPVVLTGIRYLTPAPLAAAALLALATRAGSWVRVGAVAVLLAALAENIREIHRDNLGFPFRPGLPMSVALLVGGSVVAGLLARRALAVRLLRTWGLTAAAVVVGAALLAIPASRFLPRYLDVSQRHQFGDAVILRYLATQPGWVHGDAPVAAGSEAYSTLAGPHFSHPLSYIADNEPCASIQAAAHRGWVVLEPITGMTYPGLDYVQAPACMARETPVATLPGGIKIYAPPSLASRG
jgi:hypothetical protein